MLRQGEGRERAQIQKIFIWYIVDNNEIQLVVGKSEKVPCLEGAPRSTNEEGGLQIQAIFHIIFQILLNSSSSKGRRRWDGPRGAGKGLALKLATGPAEHSPGPAAVLNKIICWVWRYTTTCSIRVMQLSGRHLMTWACLPYA